jgi:hypothetical protein
MEEELSLVYPSEADVANNMISVLSPWEPPFSAIGKAMW